MKRNWLLLRVVFELELLNSVLVMKYSKCMLKAMAANQKREGSFNFYNMEMISSFKNLEIFYQ